MTSTTQSSGVRLQERSNEFVKVPLPADLATREIQLAENARAVLEKRYLRRGADGKPVENIAEMFWRVAYHVALAETQLGSDHAQTDFWARRFFDLLTNLEFFPNSPTFTGAGTPLGQLAACFVLKIEDDMGRTGEGIFDTLRHAALIQQTGGGNGFAFSRLRPKGALVKSSSGTATGPLGFLRVYDQAFGEIAQGGCLTPDTLVFTEHGLLRLDEIVTATQPGWSLHEIHVATDEGTRPSYQGYHHGISPVLTIRTDAGLRLTGTPNHKVKVLTDNGTAWRRFDELQFGDSILVKLGQHQGSVQPLGQPALDDKMQETLQFPAVLNEALALFLGTLSGSSFAGADEHCIRITIPAGNGLSETMPELIWELFGDSITIRRHEEYNKSTTFVLEHDKVKDFLALNGLDTPPLGVPRLIRQSPPEIIAAFIRGLFEVCGVHADDFAELTLTSERVAQEIGTLLIGLGSPVCISPLHNRSAWALHTDKHDLDSILNRTQSAFLPRRYPQFDYTALDTTYSSQPITAAALLSENTTASDELWSVMVESVEDAGEALTLDLEVEENHTYLANGMVSHNSRRGANMAVLRVDHPDIREFIKCKSAEGTITNFNISVGITDKFMEAVEKGEPFDLINPQDGSVWETVDARELFEMIVQYAHHNGEPGVLFLDAANRENPVPHLYELEATNPCGEQFLGPFENCCLGSVNLAPHVTADGKVDWQKLANSVATSTRFLDDVVTANAYVPAIPQLREAAERVRRIGLGIMGLGDMMYKLGIRYGSIEGQEFASQIMEFVRFVCMQTSIKLAEERGPFLAIEGSLYDRQNLKWEAPTPIVEHKTDWGRPTLDWKEIEKGIRQYGIRNGAQTTIAPTGTIATVAGCESYGCEPVFALAYLRYVNTNAGNSTERMTLQYTSPLFEKALLKAGLDQKTIDRIVEKVNLNGSCQDVMEVPENIRRVFVVSSDITVDQHIRMQAALQAHTDNAISKTINAPASATEADVAKAYMLGWKLGCKGMTVYVTGSRETVVLETKETRQKKETEKIMDNQEALEQTSVELKPTPLFNEDKKPRPRSLLGKTYRIETPAGTTYITINENGEGEGQPFEIFMQTAKAGSEVQAVSESLGRLISYILRIASPVSPRNRVKEIVRQLRFIGGGNARGFGPNRVSSLPDGVAQILQEYIDDTAAADEIPQVPRRYRNTPEQIPLALQERVGAAESLSKLPVLNDIGDICPECGAATFIREEGCQRCHSCGYSEC